MITRPPISTLFPTRRSSDLTCTQPYTPGRWAITREPGKSSVRESGLNWDGRSSPGNCHEAARSANTSRIPLRPRSEEHTSELQSRLHLVCRLLLEKKKKKQK